MIYRLHHRERTRRLQAKQVAIANSLALLGLVRMALKGYIDGNGSTRVLVDWLVHRRLLGLLRRRRLRWAGFSGRFACRRLLLRRCRL